MTYKPKSDFLNIMQERGFINQCSDLEELDEKIFNGGIIAYIGFDCTASSLHAGHLMSIMALRHLQKTGNKPVVVLGGGTTMIGDPSGKTETRKMLDKETIAQNMVDIKQCFTPYIKFGDGKTDALYINNADWLTQFNYLEFLRNYGTQFSVNRMLTFDSVRTRLEREDPLTFLEFNYMVLQAVDFVELHKRYGVSLQMGGSDQWGNIINGIDLGRKIAGYKLFCMTTPLLTTASGAKMGKSENGAVWLRSDLLSPWDFWQYFRNIDDADVEKFLKVFTELPLSEIVKLVALQGSEINEAKKILATEVTKLCHGEEEALKCLKIAQDTFEGVGTSALLPTLNYKKTNLPKSIVDFLVELELFESKAEARRMIENGGIKLSDNVCDAYNYQITEKDFTNSQVKVSIGKKRHYLINLV